MRSRPKERFKLELKHGIKLFVPPAASIASVADFLSRAVLHFERERDNEKITTYEGHPYSQYARKGGRSLGVCTLSVADYTIITVKGAEIPVVYVGPEHARPIELWIEALTSAFITAVSLAELIEKNQVLPSEKGRGQLPMLRKFLNLRNQPHPPKP